MYWDRIFVQVYHLGVFERLVALYKQKLLCFLTLDFDFLDFHN